MTYNIVRLRNARAHTRTSTWQAHDFALPSFLGKNALYCEGSRLYLYSAKISSLQAMWDNEAPIHHILSHGSRPHSAHVYTLKCWEFDMGTYTHLEESMQYRAWYHQPLQVEERSSSVGGWGKNMPRGLCTLQEDFLFSSYITTLLRKCFRCLESAFNLH